MLLASSSSSLSLPSLSASSTIIPQPSLALSNYRHLHFHVRCLHPPIIASAALTGRGHLAAGAYASGDGGSSEASPEEVETTENTGNAGHAYLGLFVRMLGLDNDPLDREQAIDTLWKYSQGGRKCIDEIMQFPGCINLIISLLKSDSAYSCEAAAGLLHNITSVKLYRDVAIGSGAMEEISSLLCKSTITPETKEQCLYTMWNLSIDEDSRLKIAKSDFLIKLIRFLDDEDIEVKEAAAGIISNLALSHRNHGILVEAGVIPKLVALFQNEDDNYKIIRKESRSALLELCGDDCYHTLIIQEGLVRVPLVGVAAYKAFKPATRLWPSFPDGCEIQRCSRPSRYGAIELLLGLSVDEKKMEFEEAKINAIIGRSNQHWLARIGAIEEENGEMEQSSSSNCQHTILPWIDAVARLVLILGLEDGSAITKAANAIGDASINEHMRLSFKEAGAVRPLLELLQHSDKSVREAAANALDKLSVSSTVCLFIEAEGALELLVNILKDPATPIEQLEKSINILSRIFDMGINMEAMSDSYAVDGPEDVVNTESNSQGAMNGLLGRTSRTLSGQQKISRESIIDFSVISRLTYILSEASPTMQTKVASILEYLAASEQHVTAMTASGIGSALEVVFEIGDIHGRRGDPDNIAEFCAAEAEEVSQPVPAAARLLTKLMDFNIFLGSINCGKFVVLFRSMLKSSIPLHSKDWVAACLVKLQSKIASATDHGVSSVDVEITIYKTIPQLVEQMMTSFSYEAKRDAVIELNRIISEGLMEYSRAVATAGAIFPLVKMIEEGDGDALEASLSVLYNLSMDPENHSAIISAGAVPLLKRIVTAEGPQWARALQLLRTLPT